MVRRLWHHRHDVNSARPQFDQRLLDRPFSVTARAVKSGEIPGAVLAVASRDEVVRTEAFGGPAGARITTEHRFGIASITKPIVATAMLQLVEAGSLVLSDPVARYLPGFRPPPAVPGEPGGEAITVWHLLTHTSGMADVDRSTFSRTPPDADRMVRLAATRPLTFAPGTSYRYCSDTFFVLGAIAQRLTDLPLSALLQERIFEPLGMAVTSFARQHAAAASAPVSGADLAPDQTSRLVAWLEAVEYPGGGLWSAAPDLVRFGQAMLEGGVLDGRRVLGGPFVEFMTREQTRGIQEPGRPPREPHYGLGWDKPGLDGRLPGSPRAFGHSGMTGCRLTVDPEAGIVIVFLANVVNLESRYWQRAAAAVYGALENRRLRVVPAPPRGSVTLARAPQAHLFDTGNGGG
jgi:CubicO group peptidase (beta-lactamase class C family)